MAEPEMPYLDVDVTVPLHEFQLQVRSSLFAGWTVLFGPSGAGKTTLLRTLCGLTQPKQGRITLRSKVLLDTSRGISVAPADRGMGYVAQQPALFPTMNVIENVLFGLSRMSRGQAIERAQDMLALTGASHLTERSAKKLSGGERQRVALARALAPQPQLLLLDEPFAGLDADLKDGLLERLTAWLAQSGTAALYVTHDAAEVFRTASGVLVMENGEIKAHGPADTVLAEQRLQLLRRLGALRPTPEA